MKETLQFNITIKNGKIIEMDCYEGISRVEFLCDCEDPISIRKCILWIKEELEEYK